MAFRKIWIVLILVTIIAVPLIFAFIVPHMDDLVHTASMLKASKRRVGSNYKIVNTIPNYTIELKDTAYLDYITGQLTIFSPNGVIDVAANSGHREVKKRYTVTDLRIEFVSKLDRYILGLSGNETFSSWGTYAVEGNVLVVKIALNFNDSMLSSSPTAPEEVFLDTLYQTLYFAHGVTYGVDFTEGFEKNKKDMLNFLRTGIFAWPVKISRNS